MTERASSSTEPSPGADTAASTDKLQALFHSEADRTSPAQTSIQRPTGGVHAHNSKPCSMMVPTGWSSMQCSHQWPTGWLPEKSSMPCFMQKPMWLPPHLCFSTKEDMVDFQALFLALFQA
ncbi:uncharacterized [Tachysurus ichikawai]